MPDPFGHRARKDVSLGKREIGIDEGFPLDGAAIVDAQVGEDSPNNAPITTMVGLKGACHICLLFPI
jgi:hypothetical protein